MTKGTLSQNCKLVRYYVCTKLYKTFQNFLHVNFLINIVYYQVMCVDKICFSYFFYKKHMDPEII